ncbi:THO2 plays a role in transcriptional elongation [Dispira parvispora]|uniref:THO complex subunit 2 n=1 Tax=Dispira parvispora TaxID=1520584 RepID=A0A9W8B1I8_9FUNG|nr:THO2 plays a role in transcriptional elongation [Dispira parvispora]
MDATTTVYQVIADCCVHKSKSATDTLTVIRQWVNNTEENASPIEAEAELDGVAPPSQSPDVTPVSPLLSLEDIVDIFWLVYAQLKEYPFPKPVDVPAPTAPTDSVQVPGISALPSTPPGLHLATSSPHPEPSEPAPSPLQSRYDRFFDLVRQFRESDIGQKIPTSLLKERWEPELLEAVKVIPSATLFSKKSIRINTTRLYRQFKFNLLREESEGFSKLIVFVTHAMETVTIDTPQDTLHTVASELLDRIQTTMGYFSLDFNRTVDLLLDLFISHVETQYPFFLEVLRQLSLLAPSSKASPPMSPEEPFHLDRADLPEILAQGSTRLAQLLGFKFQMYQSVTELLDTPRSLYMVAALLLRHRFVNLGDLYPYLSPDDTQAAEEYDQYRKRLADQAEKSGLSLLASMPSLDELESGHQLSTTSAANATSKDTQEKYPLSQQKAGLLVALLHIGELPLTLIFLRRFPHLPACHPEVADGIIRCLHVMIDPLWQEVHASRTHPRLAHAYAMDVQCQLTSTASESTTTLPKGSDTGSDLRITPKPTGYTKDPQKQASVDHRWQYFFRDWKAHIPLYSDSVVSDQTRDDQSAEAALLSELPLNHSDNNLEDPFLRFVWPWLKFLGRSLSRDTVLFAKLCRIGRHRVAQDMPNPACTTTSHSRSQDWMQCIRLFFIPAFSLVYNNVGLTNDLWALLSLYPYTKRYGVYGEWRSITYSKYPELGPVKSKVAKEARSALRRMGTSNVRLMGHMFCKYVHANPTLVFSIALDQVQSYDNMIFTLVEVLRYLTPLGYDVLTFTMLDAISNPKKPRLKPDRTNLAHWLKSMALFSATAMRRFSMLNLSAYLQFIVRQLRRGHLTDLTLLEEIIGRLAGVEPVPASASRQQLLKLSGGPLLIAEALAPLAAATQQKFYLRPTLRSTQRLLHALCQPLRESTSTENIETVATPLTPEEQEKMSWEVVPTLVASFAVTLAQQRCVSVFLNTNSWLSTKLLSNMYDQCHESLQQYTDLLQVHLPIDQYIRFIPSWYQLCREYGIEPAVAWRFVRPVLKHLSKSMPDPAAKKNGGTAAATISRAETPTLASSDSPLPTGTANATDATVADGTADGELPLTTEVMETDPGEGASAEITLETPEYTWRDLSNLDNVWPPYVKPMYEQCYEVLPQEVWKNITPQFYVTFWRLTLNDLQVPREQYNDVVSRYRQQAEEANRAKKESERDSLRASADQFGRELIQQTAHCNRTLKQAELESGHWFTHQGMSLVGSRSDVADTIIQYCLYPRIFYSPNDAVFCAKWIQLLHKWNTPSFYSLVMYDQLFIDITGIVFSRTEMEAHCYGEFLNTCLQRLTEWFLDESLFTKHTRGDGLHGFQKRWLPNSRLQPTAPVNPEDLLQYEDYRHVMLKWHVKLHHAFDHCLKSTDYIHRRNAILILTKIQEYFPLYRFIGMGLQDKVQQVYQEEKREDLKVLALGYRAVLKKNSTRWIRSAKDEPESDKPSDPVESEDGEMEEGEAKEDDGTTTVPSGASAQGQTAPGSSGNRTIGVTHSEPQPTTASRRTPPVAMADRGSTLKSSATAPNSPLRERIGDSGRRSATPLRRELTPREMPSKEGGDSKVSVPSRSDSRESSQRYAERDKERERDRGRDRDRERGRGRDSGRDRKSDKERDRYHASQRGQEPFTSGRDRGDRREFSQESRHSNHRDQREKERSRLASPKTEPSSPTANNRREPRNGRRSRRSPVGNRTPTETRSDEKPTERPKRLLAEVSTNGKERGESAVRSSTAVDSGRGNGDANSQVENKSKSTREDAATERSGVKRQRTKEDLEEERPARRESGIGLARSGSLDRTKSDPTKSSVNQGDTSTSDRTINDKADSTRDGTRQKSGSDRNRRGEENREHDTTRTAGRPRDRGGRKTDRDDVTRSGGSDRKRRFDSGDDSHREEKRTRAVHDSSRVQSSSQTATSGADKSTSRNDRASQRQFSITGSAGSKGSGGNDRSRDDHGRQKGRSGGDGDRDDRQDSRRQRQKGGDDQGDQQSHHRSRRNRNYR